jgi:hypothetical protein
MLHLPFDRDYFQTSMFIQMEMGRRVHDASKVVLYVSQRLLKAMRVVIVGQENHPGSNLPSVLLPSVFRDEITDRHLQHLRSVPVIKHPKGIIEFLQECRRRRKASSFNSSQMPYLCLSSKIRRNLFAKTVFDQMINPSSLVSDLGMILGQGSAFALLSAMSIARELPFTIGLYRSMQFSRYT